MNIPLTLRVVNSPYGDITKGSILSAVELDNNFLHIKGDVIYSGLTSGSTVTLFKNNGETFSFDVFTGNTHATGLTYNPITYNLSLSLNNGDIFTSNLASLASDVTITGGTFNNGVITFVNTSGGTFSVSGFTVFTGGTVGGLTATTISASTYLGLPTDVRITGGTYNNGVATFINNTGGTFSVSGFFTGSTSSSDTFVTGGTANNNTKTYTFTNNTGGTFTINSLTDITVTGGTYNNGVTTFTNNTGGTFSVTGFSTGTSSSDTFVTGMSYTNNVLTLGRNNNQGDLSVLINSMSALSATTLSATTYLGLPTDVRVTGGTYNNGIATFTNNTGGTFSVSGFFTGSTSTPAEVVFFDTANPNNSGTTFNPNSPMSADTLYVSTTNSSTWIYSGSTYISYTSSTINNTEWYLNGTTTDAGDNKTAHITRYGNVTVGGIGAVNDRFSVILATGQKPFVVDGNNGYVYSQGKNGSSTSTVYGLLALASNAGSISNTIFGHKAGFNVTTGSSNTIFGYNTGLGLTEGNYNTIIGSNITGLTSGLSNTIILSDGNGNIRLSANSSNQVYVNDINIQNITTGTSVSSLGIDGTGKVIKIQSSSSSDTFVTGGTYSNGVATYVNNTGGTFSVTGFSVNYWVSGSSGNFSIKRNNDTTIDATGNYSYAEGSGTTASGLTSHAEGGGSKALGDYSHAEGFNTIASGTSTHAEGGSTIASGQFAHAEGSSSKAFGQYSHAEGNSTTASGIASHSEGNLTIALGDYSHVSGLLSVASGQASHVSGKYVFGVGDSSVVMGRGSFANMMGDFVSGIQNISGGKKVIFYNNGGVYYNASLRTMYVTGDVTAYSVTGSTITWAHSNNNAMYQSVVSATTYNGTYTSIQILSDPTGGVNDTFLYEFGFLITDRYTDTYPSPRDVSGYQTVAYGSVSHTEGKYTTAYGNYSHAEGYNTTTIGVNSHAEGFGSVATGNTSHAEGDSSKAYGNMSHAEGNLTTASGTSSHAEGRLTIASNSYSHAEGNGTTASGIASHAEGQSNLAFGNYSHAEGNGTTASGITSHAEGQNTTAIGSNSHAGGNVSIALGQTSFVHGNNSYAGGDGTIVLGNNVSGVTDNTVFVNALNIKTFSGGNSSIILTLDSNNNITTGTTTTFTGGTVNGLTATTISATTYLGLPTDVTVTGGTYSDGTTTFTNNTGGTFNVSGFFTGITEGAYAKISGDTFTGDVIFNTKIGVGSSGFSVTTPERILINDGVGTGFSNTLVGKADRNSYVQLNINNSNSGSSASSDVVATADNGNESTNFIDMGINSSSYSGSIGVANDGYLYTTGKKLLLGNTTDNNIEIFRNNVTVCRFQTSGVTFSGSVQEGSNTNASGVNSHAEGSGTTASGNYSHAGGNNSSSIGISSFVHGSNSTAIGNGTVVLGDNISGINHNTLYVKDLNIGVTTGSTSNTIVGLSIDINGNVVKNFNEYIPQVRQYANQYGYTTFNNSATLTIVGGMTAAVTVGTLTAIAITTANTVTRAVRVEQPSLAATAGSKASVRSGAAIISIGEAFRFSVGFAVRDVAYVANASQFYGLSQTTTELNITNTARTAQQQYCIGIGSDAVSGDTNLQIFYNLNSPTCTKIDLGSNFPANRTSGASLDNLYIFSLYSGLVDDTVRVEVINRTTGAIYQGSIPVSSLPQGFMTMHALRTNGTTALAVRHAITHMHCYI